MTASDRKPQGMGWESFAERRVREAIESGEFKNLPGFGQPIPDIDEPWDENSWLRKKLKSEEIRSLPPILEARLRIQEFRDSLATIPSETELRRRLTALNKFITDAHFSHIQGPSESVHPLDEADVVGAWRQARSH
ncbi:MAG: DUF1992 domain-containing protein [Planctomycetaceae bacterium]|nr:DUF1992 domain-containing protein [Planctomycetaceae bacterium]